MFTLKSAFGEFPGGPVVRTQCFHCQGRIGSLVMELRSCKLRGQKNERKKKEKHFRFLMYTIIFNFLKFIKKSYINNPLNICSNRDVKCE